jgi:hypothetical protein
MFMQRGGGRGGGGEEEERCGIRLTAVHYYQHKHYHDAVITTFEVHFPLSHLMLRSVALSILTWTCLSNSFFLFSFQAPPDECQRPLVQHKLRCNSAPF